MTPNEVNALLALVKSLRPQQAWDEFSEEAWQMALADNPDDPGQESIDARDALTAVRRLSRTATWIGTDNVAQEALRVRADRLERMVVPVPDVDPDDVQAYIRAYRENVKRVAHEPPPAEIPANPEGQARLRELAGELGRPRALRALEAPGAVEHKDAPEVYFQARAEAEGRSPEFMRQRAQALTVPCEERCGAAVGARCTHPDGRLLESSAAHPSRMAAAGLEVPVTRVYSRAEIEAYAARLEGGVA